MNFKRINSNILILICAMNTVSSVWIKSNSGIQNLSKPVYNVKSFGAVGDGLTLCTDAIQSAINSIYQIGGGTVIISQGTFLTGSIEIKTGVRLNIFKGATVLGSTNPLDYRKIKDHLALILADHAHNFSITGHGSIDGQGLALALVIDSLHHSKKMIDPNYNYRRMRPSENVRPQIINFSNCSGITVKNITIINSAGWVTKYNQCNNINMDSITVSSIAYWNNDGMDICDCTNVKINNCYVNSADDGICLKSMSPVSCDDSIYISNCTIRSSASAIKFGTDSYGGFKNIKIEKIKVFDTFRSAIAIESVDGGIVDNVNISDVEAKNTGNAIFIRLGRRNVYGNPGSLRNVKIENLKVTVPFERPDMGYDLRGPDLPFFHNTFPSSITGIPGHNVENITLENIEITYPGRATKGMAYAALYRLDQVPENEAEYPEFSMFGELPAWGFYVRHVKGLTMKKVILRVKANDYRAPFVFDDTKDLLIANADVHVKDGPKQIVLNNVSQCEIENSKINDKNDYNILQLGSCKSVKSSF